MSAPGDASTSLSAPTGQASPAGPDLRIRAAVDDRDVAVAAGIVSTAFASLDACEWLLAGHDVKDRVPILSEIFAITVADAVEHGTVYLASSSAGDLAAAVWFDRTRPVPEPDDYERRLVAAAGSAHDRFAHLDLLFEQHHPEQPHHHLAFLAVLPQCQGRSIGTTLLERHHAGLDEAGHSAYLEASSADSARLYKRQGYAPHGEDFTLPNGATFTPLWREPVSDVS
jgi:ribosomal protein S18 acetylase RimI-like enzyme